MDTEQLKIAQKELNQLAKKEVDSVTVDLLELPNIPNDLVAGQVNFYSKEPHYHIALFAGIDAIPAAAKAILAHEIGHIQQEQLQLPLNEADVIKRGGEIAKRWSVLSEYISQHEKTVTKPMSIRALEELRRSK